MADFVSTQSGNVNDGATFGNASPGVKGTDWPGLAGDTFTVTNGHTVVYNVSETNELGQVDVAGKLSFDDGGDRLLTLAHVNLNVANGGELEIGTSGSNFAAAQKAEVLWNTTGDNTKGLWIGDGGKLTIYGASDYCAVYEDTLADDAENTDGDAIIKTVTDMSADWHIGDELTIKVENAGDSTSYVDAVKRAVIQSFDGGDGTLITLDINITAAAGVGDTWTSPVVNVTRNVRFGKLNADVACGDGSTHYNVNRSRFKDRNGDGNNNCVFSHAMATGFYSIDSDYDFQFLNSVVRNGFLGFIGGISHVVSGSVYGNDRGFLAGTGHVVSADVYANRYGFSTSISYVMSGNLYSNHYNVHAGTGHIVSGDIHGADRGLNEGSGHVISGNVYANKDGVYSNMGHTVSGRIGYDGNDVSRPNTSYDFNSTGHSKHKLLNAKLPLAGLTVRRNAERYTTRIMCEHHDRVVNTHKIYDNNGDVVKVACDGGGDRPSEDPDGTNGNCIELSNIQSGCNSNNPLRAWEPHQVRVWATAAVAKTYTFQVQTTYAGISAGNLQLTANYLDEGSGGHLGEETNAPAINQRADATDWTQTLAVTVNPSQTGWVDFEIKLMEYESGNEVWIWPQMEIT